ncbi:glycoside hydrolase family 43 C-terminal domain-containing protein [uncultured Sunxiuqinia sp.]|uniref:lipocalin-like domain-containing protein n=1 Tax=uncultured Sunxiuqinia sp. TaxID=1573825 RepID=UPI0030DB9AE7|tara:strand:+ start:1679 stop:1891 length:213 start_codon:yes stop_codon:yes gene_type:complete
MILQSDRIATGDFSGSWSLDQNKQTLHIGNLEVIIQKGYNWESSPRQSTLVLSGFTSSKQPVWGKKVRAQ